MLSILKRSALGASLMFMAIGSLAGPASARYHQDGRVSHSHSVDGSYSRLAGNKFNVQSSQCVIYSVMSADWTVQRLVQSGVVRCKGIPLDSSACPGGHAFVERAANASTYYCTAGYNFTKNTKYDATTYRTSATGSTFTGHINGASAQQSGMGVSDDIRAYAWGEATGNNYSCPAPAKGTFALWKRYNTSSGWHYITNSSLHRVNSGMQGACWPTVSAVSSGSFYVD